MPPRGRGSPVLLEPAMIAAAMHELQSAEPPDPANVAEFDSWARSVPPVTITVDQRDRLSELFSYGALSTLAPGAARALRVGASGLAAPAAQARAARIAEALGAETPADAVKRMNDGEAARGGGGFSIHATATSFAALRLGTLPRANALARRSPPHLLQIAAGGGGYSTSDFAMTLGNAVRRSLTATVALYEPVYERIASVEAARDFRREDVVSIGVPGEMAEIAEGGSFPSVEWTERRESLTAKTFGRRCSLSTHIMVNDDVGLLRAMIEAMSAMIAVVPDRLIIQLLAQNNWAGPTLSDGSPLFSNAHKNSGEPATLSEVAVRRARRQMLAQADKSTPLASDLRVLVTGPENAEMAELLGRSDLASFTGPNGSLRPFIEHAQFRLAPSTGPIGSRWWLFQNPGPGSSLHVRFIGGNAMPRVFVPPQSDPLQFDFVVWHPGVSAGVVGFENAYSNPG